MYDHSRKIGNKGDLIKHFALTVAVKEMATGKDAFCYLDVHSGRSTYDLPDFGEWKTGIGKFAKHCLDQQSLSADLRYFCEVQSVADVSQTRKYAGSSRIILNVLRGVGVKRISPILCDTNREVCQDLGTQFQDAQTVEIFCADGYQMAQEVEEVDLVFIDPPDIQDHYQPFMTLIRYCVTQGKPFVSWNPLHGNVPQQIMSRNCLSVVELAEKERIPSITVRWTEGWSGQMCGCQMLFSIPSGNKVANACDSLIGLMGWKRIYAQVVQPRKTMTNEWPFPGS